VLSRRSFLRVTLASAAGAAAAGVYTWQVEPHWLEIVRRPLAIRHLPDALAGRTLVQLSDIHVGPRVSDDYVRRSFEQVRALDPDLVIFTGDFTSYHAEILDQMRPVYDSVPHGRLATLGSFGNHDYGPGWAHPEIAAEFRRALADRGVEILQNEIRDVDGLTIVGLDDLWANRFAPGAILPRIRADRPALVLSHNPDTVDLPVWGDYRGWVLAGHTHGGQCRPPFLPPPILPVRNHRYTAGEFEVGGGRRLYISRGLGHLLQVRFNVRPEVTVFQLVPET
jgi:predicted MPP superfamily phosphohydrolase